MSRHARVLIALVVTVSLVSVVAGGPPPDRPTQTTDPGTATNFDSRSTPAEPGTPNDSASETVPRITAVAANPVADRDRGEYVELRLPPGAWVLTAGDTRVNLTGPGRVVVTNDPAALRAGPAEIANDSRVVEADLGLANGGGRLTVGPATRDTATEPNRTRVVVYRDAPEGEVYRPAAGEWQPAGLADRSVVRLGPANGTAFLLPDTPGVVTETVRGADRRLFVAGYTITSERIRRLLVDAARRGVTVRVLVEGGPVGGISQRQAELLSRLADAGVAVRVVAGPAPRVRYHHPKYAVVDDAALVLTENWKPSGTGGGQNRGWGVRLADRAAARELAAVFEADWTARDAIPWDRFRRGRTFEPASPTNDSYPTRFDPTQFTADDAYLLTAPGNAGRGVVSVIDTADSRVEVIQPTVSRGPPLQAIKRAAERGVRVRLLLSGAWYAREENQRLADGLNEWADRTDASLSARVAESGSAFGAIHAKGLIVDDTVVVGSLNWTPTSRTENREVAVAIRDRALARYYRTAFSADWTTPDDRTLPPTLAVVAVGAVAAAAVLVARHVTFADVGA